MSDVAEATKTKTKAAVQAAAQVVSAPTAAPVVVQAAAPAAKAKNFRFPSRRGQRVQTKAEVDATRLLIDDFIAKRGVTRCPTGYASGAVQTQYDFI